jgi:GNAT superfamily N-acetyltransferase
MFQASGPQPRSRKFFEDMLQGPDSGVIVADAGQQLVGLAHGVMRSAPELPVFVQQRWGVLDGLVVDPACRRRGVGRRLTEAFEQWALDRGASWVELNVYEFNAEARGFYESLGYLPLSTKLRRPRRDPV